MEITRESVTQYQEEVPKDVEGFMDWRFTSGGTTGPDFNEFARLFKIWLKKQLPATAQLVNFNKGHYYLSGFITNKTGRHVYFNVGDVRFNRNWHNSIYVRTAKSDRDYTGGQNVNTSLESMVRDALELISSE